MEVVLGQMTSSLGGQANSFGIRSVDSVDQSSDLKDEFAKRGQDELARERRRAVGPQKKPLQ